MIFPIFYRQAIIAQSWIELNIINKMSVTADELIELTIRNLILKCEVKPYNHPPIQTEKISQRVTLLPTPSTPIVASSEPK